MYMYVYITVCVYGLCVFALGRVAFNWNAVDIIDQTRSNEWLLSVCGQHVCYSHIAKHVHYQLASIQDKPLGQGLSYGLVSSHSNKLSVNP